MITYTLFRNNNAAQPTSSEAAGTTSGKNQSIHRVVIVGGGFGGLSAARSLSGESVHVTLIDRRNFHLFQPLLYQVAPGQLSPADIASPLRAVVARQKNVSVLENEVVDILPDEQRVVLREGESVPYDTLVIAAGSTSQYFGRNDWEIHAPGLKSIEDATAIRSQILSTFEQAERTNNPETLDSLLTFVIVGGGPTGVELAGAIGELTQHTLKDEYRSIHTPNAKILLVEGTDRILSTYPQSLSAAARKALSRLGVTVLTNTLVSEIEPERVTLRQEERTWCLPAHTVLWAAGVQASPLGAVVARRTGVNLDRSGRVRVEPDCSLAGYPNILVIGDMACFDQKDGDPLPEVAPVALQQGLYVADLIRRRLRGKRTRPFHYRDRGSLAVIGRAAAVANIWGLRFSGPLAWLLWLFVHVMQLVEFENRLLVFIQWLFSYVTGKRSAGLITRLVTRERALERH